MTEISGIVQGSIALVVAFGNDQARRGQQSSHYHLLIVMHRQMQRCPCPDFL